MTTEFIVGAIVIGVGFVLDTKYNDRLGEIVEVCGEMEVRTRVDDSTETVECYMVKWRGEDEPELNRKYNLRLWVDGSDEGEQSIMDLFKVLPNKYNFTHHQEIKEEMEADVVKIEEMEESV